MRAYVLETTPLDQSKSDSDILLLGSWCKTDDERHVTIADYHWDDRAKLYEDYKYILSLYEKYLIRASNSLNQIHKTNHHVDYWRAIVGPWLHYFISIVFDRYEMLAFAAKKYNIKYAKEPIYDPDCWVPIDYADFNYQFYSDEWNYYLYSEVIKYTKLIPTKKSAYKLTPNHHNRISGKYRFLKSFIFLLTKLTSTNVKKVLFVEVNIPQKSLYRLLYRLKSFSFSYYLRVKPKFFKLDHGLRSSFFTNFGGERNFEKLLDKLIPMNIPISYVEGYEDLVKNATQIFPKKVKLMITSNAHVSNEHFKVWCAGQKLNNSKLWILAHGGHHGTALFNGPGKFSEDIADRYYGWGWGEYNLPSTKLSILQKHKISQSGDKILFIPYNISKYSNHLDSSPISSSFNDCIKMHSNLFDRLETHKLKDEIIIRFKSSRSLWNLDDVYHECGISNFVYSNEESLINSISRSALVIVTYDSTVFLEALTLNVPTCLFIRKDYWEMSKASARFFKMFIDCGILHYDEDTLVNHILEIRDDYLKWWYSDSVQKSINSFLIEYGLSSNCWQDDWFNEIQDGLKGINS